MPITYFRLSSEDRIKIETYLSQDKSLNQISIKLGVHRSSISREIKRNTDSQGKYRAKYAQNKSKTRSRSRKLGKRRILLRAELKQYIESKLQLTWSPYQIAKMLKIEFSTDISMQVSHESIYQYIYVLPRGELKESLLKGLRQSRNYRRTQRQQKQG